MTIDNFKEKYIELANNCNSTDYDDEKSVNSHNKSVDEMRNLVSKVNDLAEEEKLLFFDLLNDNELITKWLSFQVIELMNLPTDIENKAFKIIKDISTGDSIEAIGATEWLNNRK